MTDRHVLISLNRVPGFGAVKARALEAAFGSFGAASTVSLTELKSVEGLSELLAERVYAALHSTFAEEEERRASQMSVKILTLLEKAYPDSLRSIPNPPLVLYCVGDETLLSQSQVAMVGTRRASVYGMDQAKRFALALAQVGIHVTSGLAEGIDTVAHEGALLAASEGKTIAVVGAALDAVYPSTRKPLARKIVHAGGCVVSEYAFGRHADAQTFPMRNRIVAGLSNGVLIVETAVRGGTMITATYAQQYGRTLWVIPGRVDVPSFAGNLSILREDAGRIVTCPAQIIETFGSLDLREDSSATSGQLPVGLSTDELAVWQAADGEGLSMDMLAETTGLSVPQVMAITITLQMRKLLKPTADGRLRRAR